MKISFDTELMSADNSFTRISPRQTQEYRLRNNLQTGGLGELERVGNLLGRSEQRS